MFILQPTPGPVRFMRFKIYDCFREVCVTSLLSLLCDLIVTSNVNNEVAVCMQAEVSYLVEQKQTAAVSGCFEELLVCFGALCERNSGVSVKQFNVHVSETQYLLCNSLKLLSHSLTLHKSFRT